ncbi:MAG: 50S ribosomal protein L18 [Deltaproteobacteria bacterium RIFCSPLOWO2_12_FULL_44_12]|nr:MAG: 50S ribosomal protein L18 [Deltaproteobacteria bacterium RIFCSPHIGHO2_01_FULL_43_49]OGQ14957.1 MAG: 50S ribosomal protein L18 [Deltaproteobacteria bacterium RIFCSPHIGHO2_02_FULL_44_53]OGQ29540.1 MAG: 50S ribosomal protein L18 [Deltaproteobacteria bacterium RIFCSPHIGHO2_12_FULL_44_21]OGQ31069.1 MAG: 50S ribosomal protein L18 [Deltaproteobacteria bacterium RIFCSPLOWO2_01_FULL_45_74]OGQ42671.1 MAG: 50S ribosomal protein L18 [Deltaproteobacteria bacterium RIFCSPLOWO2_02_FULL_44_34]OGQ70851
MKHQSERQLGRLRRKLRIRQFVKGNSERPRLSVFKSAKHLYAQLIDDLAGKTLVSSSTLDKELKSKAKGTLEGAKQVGKLLAQRALKKGIKKVVFDRGGFKYHGQLKALADVAREAGLQF